VGFARAGKPCLCTAHTIKLARKVGPAKAFVGLIATDWCKWNSQLNCEGLRNQHAPPQAMPLSTTAPSASSLCAGVSSSSTARAMCGDRFKVEMEQRPSFPRVRHLGNVQWCCIHEMHPLEDALDLRSPLVHQRRSRRIRPPSPFRTR
jgi:hypothetical protein